MAKRKPIAPILASKFSVEYNAAMLHYNTFEKIELTKYLMNLFQVHLAYKEPSKAQLKSIKEELEKIKLTYGKRLKAFKNAQLHKYINFDIVISEKEIYTDEEFNEMEQQGMTDSEIETFLNLVGNLLEFQLDELYLELEPTELERPEKGLPKIESIDTTNIDWKGAAEIVKSKTKRGKEDKYTVLNEKQTALLIAYLRQFKVFFREANCDFTKAGLAVNILTGYSMSTIRQDLGKKDIIDTKENRAELKMILNRILGNIDKGLTEEYK